MKKLGLFLFILSLFIPVSLRAELITDLQINTPNGWTDPFAIIKGNDNVISYFGVSDINGSGNLDRGDITIGTQYHDFGHFIANWLYNEFGVAVDDKGMNDTTNGWELTISWADLQGTIIEIEPDDYIKGAYTGGTFAVYLDTSPDYYPGVTGSPYDYWDGTTVQIDNDTGYNDGIKIMEIEVIEGEAIAPFSKYSSLAYRNATLVGRVTYIDTNYIKSTEYDLGTLVMLNWMISIATESAPTDALTWLDNTTGYPISDDLAGYDFSNGYIAQYGGGTATIKFNAVPEPATIMLMGAGLLCLGFVVRRRK